MQKAQSDPSIFFLIDLNLPECKAHRGRLPQGLGNLTRRVIQLSSQQTELMFCAEFFSLSLGRLLLADTEIRACDLLEKLVALWHSTVLWYTNVQYPVFPSG